MQHCFLMKTALYCKHTLLTLHPIPYIRNEVKSMTQEEKSIQLCEKLLPLLKEGKEVEIHPSGTRDILLYQRESGLLVLHRLCRIKQDGYYFTGDNQTEVEGPLQASQLLAIVTCICRNGHTFRVTHPVYKICSRIWLFLRPVRPFISRPLGMLWRRLRRSHGI